MRNLKDILQEGFYNNIQDISPVPLIQSYKQKMKYHNNSTVLWSIIWLLYKNGYLTASEIERNFPSTTRVIYGSGIPSATAFCSGYSSKTSIRRDIRNHYLHPVISSVKGTEDRTQEFRDFLDFLHIPYEEGSVATGRQVSPRYNFIKIPTKR